MAGLNSQNKKVVDDAFKAFGVVIDDTVYRELDKFCVDILRRAVFERLHSIDGHDFTGNLINSICVLLYRKSKGNVTKYFAFDKAGVKLPIRRELTGINTRGRQRRNRIWFRPDWSGEQSALKGSELIGTDQSWGQNDAQEFANNWLPKTQNCDFVICVAYTAEYASFVEHERNTTGILNTEAFTAHAAIEWVGLKAA